MDPRLNPYTPGAGIKPLTLSGREKVIEATEVALDRLMMNRSMRGSIFYGLRGVGKTVLLNHVIQSAEAKKIFVIRIESPEERSLPAMLIPAIRTTLLRLSTKAAVMDKVEKAKQALAGFASGLLAKYHDIEINLDYEKEEGLADSGDLETDLFDLLKTIGEAAKSNKTAVLLAIDEMQHIPEKQMAPLITAIHYISQKELPLTLFGAGLPQLLGKMGKAKSYSERLFDFTKIDRLNESSAIDAICRPAAKEGVTYEREAINEIIKQTQGYPYFLQEWGKHCWDIAETSPITLQNAQQANQTALSELDASFFRVRFDRLTPAEKRYARAMAELGTGAHRSGDIAQKLAKDVSKTAPIRSSLIKKGMVYSPSHGDTAFTVPLFEGFLIRIMPYLEQ